MSKIFKFNNDALVDIGIGVDILADTVKSTLGPRGRNVVIERQYGPPLITKDGVTVAQEIFLEDPFQNMGAQMVKEVASKTADVAGDGTTTATVLAQAIVNEGIRAVSTMRSNPMDLKRGIVKAAKTVISHLNTMAIPCSDKSSIIQVGSIASNSDQAVGEIIAEAMERVGNDGVITIEEGQSFEDELIIVEGMKIDRGYLSSYFSTNKDNMTAEFDNPFILLYDKRISNIRELLGILEEINKTKRPILIIADDVDGEALQSLVVNHVRGIISCAAIKAPSFGDKKRAIMEDLAILTGGVLISEDLGTPLSSTRPEQLGSARRVVVGKDSTIIVDGGGIQKDLEERILHIQNEISNAENQFEREALQQRIARLTNGVAVIKIGAATDLEMKEKKDRVEDALHSTRAAVEEGIVPGGGVALLGCTHVLDNMTGDNADQTLGIKILKKALEAPFVQILENAGEESSVIMRDVLNNQEYEFGYDSATRSYVNMISAGIIDPVKVTKSALHNAVSIAATILTSSVIIAEKREVK